MTTFIDDLEEVVDIVADWGVDIILDAIGKLTTNGRAFGSVDKPEELQLEDHMKKHGNPQAYVASIDKRARDLINQLMEDGIPPEDIASIHPYDISIKYEIEEAIRGMKLMEKYPDLVGEYSARSNSNPSTNSSTTQDTGSEPVISY